MDKLKKTIKKTILSRRFMILAPFILLILLSVALNIAFSAFTNRNENEVANIKVVGMEYNITIDGISERKITIPKNKTTTANIVINALNNRDSKYELIYKVCSDSICTNYIEKPESLTIEYSSRTIDTIAGAITSNGSKQIRIAITNTSTNIYYIELGINAGFSYNTLALQNLITTEYNEEDITIAAIIDGELSTTFPTIQGNYDATVTCETNKGPSNATGTATWNGTKWVVNITGVDSGKTVCNVEFFVSLRGLILAQGGGIATIVSRGTPDFNVINGTSGIYASDDEYGTSYYYRGLKTQLNNNVIFGGFQWKIIRINGDGSIRLLYNGTESQFNTNGTMNTTGTNTQISTAEWNTTNYNDAKYVGYMYGGANGVASTTRNGTVSTAATYNETNTNIKTALDNWYVANISGKPIETNVVDNLFCNDRQLQSEVGGSSTGPGYGTGTTTYYAAYQRLYATKNPNLKCAQKNDRFTKNDTTKGNGALTYPVGLITADEASMAGLRRGSSNSTNYLYTNQYYWLLSPYHMYSGGGAYVFIVYSNGNLDGSDVGITNGLRPAVSINSSARATGTGSATDPFRVQI